MVQIFRRKDKGKNGESKSAPSSPSKGTAANTATEQSRLLPTNDKQQQQQQDPLRAASEMEEGMTTPLQPPPAFSLSDTVQYKFK